MPFAWFWLVLARLVVDILCLVAWFWPVVVRIVKVRHTCTGCPMPFAWFWSGARRWKACCPMAYTSLLWLARSRCMPLGGHWLWREAPPCAVKVLTQLGNFGSDGASLAAVERWNSWTGAVDASGVERGCPIPIAWFWSVVARIVQDVLCHLHVFG